MPENFPKNKKDFVFEPIQDDEVNYGDFDLEISVNVLRTEYRQSEDFREGVKASIRSAFKDCNVTAGDSLVTAIAERVFGIEADCCD